MGRPVGRACLWHPLVQCRRQSVVWLSCSGHWGAGPLWGLGLRSWSSPTSSRLTCSTTWTSPQGQCVDGLCRVRSERRRRSSCSPGSGSPLPHLAGEQCVFEVRRFHHHLLVQTGADL